MNLWSQPNLVDSFKLSLILRLTSAYRKIGIPSAYRGATVYGFTFHGHATRSDSSPMDRCYLKHKFKLSIVLSCKNRNMKKLDASNSFVYTS